MKQQTDTNRPSARQAGAKIPDKPRDCGPHVDTWPILDVQGRDATRPKAADGDSSKRKPGNARAT